MDNITANGSVTTDSGFIVKGKDAEGVDLEGLYYPLKDGTLTAGFPLGVSNHFTGKEATISVKNGSLLVLWDRKNGFPLR